MRIEIPISRGFGPDTEIFQRRRNYQRLNVYPWAYEDTYFISRGTRHNVRNQTDNLVLDQTENGYHSSGSFMTELLRLPPGCHFQSIRYEADTPAGTALVVNIRDASGAAIHERIESGRGLAIRQPVKLEFLFSTDSRSRTPKLDAYSLRFEQAAR